MSVFDRLRRLIDAFPIGAWVDRVALLDAVDYQQDDTATAERMLRRDLKELATLGFEVERSDGYRDPHWRIVGHARFGKEIPTKFCTSCALWKPLDAFYIHKINSPGRAGKCKECMRRADRESPTYKVRNREKARRHYARHGKKSERG